MNINIWYHIFVWYYTEIKKGIKSGHSYLNTGSWKFTTKASLETKQKKTETNTKLQAAQDYFRQKKPAKLLPSSLENSKPHYKGNNVLVGYQTTAIVNELCIHSLIMWC